MSVDKHNMRWPVVVAAIALCMFLGSAGRTVFGAGGDAGARAAIPPLEVNDAPPEVSWEASAEDGFLFDPRDRRDPFVAPFKRKGDNKAHRSPARQRQDIERACELLASLEDAFKRDDGVAFAEFQRNIENIIKREYPTDQYAVSSTEISRRVSKLASFMSVKAQLITAEKGLATMQEYSSNAQYPEVVKKAAEVNDILAGVRIPPQQPELKARYDYAVASRQKLLKKARSAMAASELKDVDSGLAQLRALIASGDFDKAIDLEKELVKKLSEVQTEDPKLLKQREEAVRMAKSLRAKAEEMARIARITAEFHKMQIVISAIAWSAQDSECAAIINDHTYEAGETMAPALPKVKIAKIEKNAVLFEFQGVSLTKKFQ